MENLYLVFLVTAGIIFVVKFFYDIIVFPVAYNNYLINCYDNYIEVLELCLKQGSSLEDVPSIKKYFKSIKEKNQDYIVSEYIVSFFTKKRFLKEIINDLNKIEDIESRNIIKRKIQDTNKEYRSLVKKSSIICQIGEYCGKFNTMRKV